MIHMKVAVISKVRAAKLAEPSKFPQDYRQRQEAGKAQGAMLLAQDAIGFHHQAVQDALNGRTAPAEGSGFATPPNVVFQTEFGQQILREMEAEYAGNAKVSPQQVAYERVQGRSVPFLLAYIADLEAKASQASQRAAQYERLEPGAPGGQSRPQGGAGPSPLIPLPSLPGTGGAGGVAFQAVR